MVNSPSQPFRTKHLIWFRDRAVIPMKSRRFRANGSMKSSKIMLNSIGPRCGQDFVGSGDSMLLHTVRFVQHVRMFTFRSLRRMLMSSFSPGSTITNLRSGESPTQTRIEQGTRLQYALTCQVVSSVAIGPVIFAHPASLSTPCLTKALFVCIPMIQRWQQWAGTVQSVVQRSLSSSRLAPTALYRLESRSMRAGSSQKSISYPKPLPEEMNP